MVWILTRLDYLQNFLIKTFWQNIVSIVISACCLNRSTSCLRTNFLKRIQKLLLCWHKLRAICSSNFWPINSGRLLLWIFQVVPRKRNTDILIMLLSTQRLILLTTTMFNVYYLVGCFVFLLSDVWLCLMMQPENLERYVESIGGSRGRLLKKLSMKKKKELEEVEKVKLECSTIFHSIPDNLTIYLKFYIYELYYK